jgi:hypothetical protein
MPGIGRTTWYRMLMVSVVGWSNYVRFVVGNSLLDRLPGRLEGPDAEMLATGQIMPNAAPGGRLERSSSIYRLEIEGETVSFGDKQSFERVRKS